MGQQQLLLIVIGVIIVGIAVVTAISLFRQGAVDNKRDLVVSEAIHLGTMAQQYYRKPATLGGGAKKFTGWKIPEEMQTTPSGSYLADVQEEQVIITGTANEVVNGTDSVKIQVFVFRDSIQTVVIH